MQKSICPQKIQKSLCITTKSLYTNSNLKRNYLENYNDSEHAVKTKNAPFFMIFPNISFFHMIVNYWTGPAHPIQLGCEHSNYRDEKVPLLLHPKPEKLPIFCVGLPL